MTNIIQNCFYSIFLQIIDNLIYNYSNLFRKLEFLILIFLDKRILSFNGREI